MFRHQHRPQGPSESRFSSLARVPLGCALWVWEEYAPITPGGRLQGKQHSFVTQCGHQPATSPPRHPPRLKVDVDVRPSGGFSELCGARLMASIHLDREGTISWRCLHVGIACMQFQILGEPRRPWAVSKLMRSYGRPVGKVAKPRRRDLRSHSMTTGRRSGGWVAFQRRRFTFESSC